MSLPGGEDGCFNYRIRQPLKAIEEHTESSTHIIDQKTDDMLALTKVLPEVDIMFMRPGSERGVEQIKNLGLPLKCKWVLDVDDNTDLISPYSQFYKEYGVREYRDGNKYVWKNGDNGFNILNNLNRVTYLKHGMINADLITCTTEKLAEWAGGFNKNVYVNDNSINFNHWWRLKNKTNKPLRILWHGSPSHYEDFYSIKEPLNKLMGEFDFEVLMLGSAYMGIFNEKHRKRVIVKPWVTFAAHSYRLMSLQADIGIIPLANLPFNQYKSAVKWYENSAIGMPSVVSNITPYREVVEDGVTAMAYNNPKDFYNKMKLLLTDAKLRQQIGNNAYKWVRKNKDQKIHAIKLLERLEDLCK